MKPHTQHIFLPLLAALAMASSAPAAVVYVDHAATGSNAGTSWANAFTNLQDALTTTAVAGEFWIAQGTYKPRLAAQSFVVTAQDALYGGFTGTELFVNQRNWINHPTILSGDLNENFNGDFGDCALLIQNTTDQNITLDGLVLAYTSGTGDAGGLRQRYGAATIANCVFHHLNGRYGGAIYTRHGGGAQATTIINSIFHNNVASEGGGAIGLYARGTLSVVNCTFHNNTSPGYGDTYFGFGGTASEGASFINCILWDDNPGSTIAADSAMSAGVFISYSLVEGGFEGFGNLNTDPLFSDVTATNFHLAAQSPCVDTGTPSAATTDIAGAPRPDGAGWDMGAYEGGGTRESPTGPMLYLR